MILFHDLQVLRNIISQNVLLHPVRSLAYLHPC